MRPTPSPSVLLAFVFSATAYGCGGQAAAPVAAQAPPVPLKIGAARAHMGQVTRGVTLPGTVRPNRQAVLYAKVPGYLKSIRVDKGDAVKAGDPIAEIEVPELIADLAKQRVEVEVAEVAWKRLRDAQVKAPNLVMPQAVDDAKGRVDIAAANLTHTETLLAFAHIVAPFDGIVTKRYVDQGAFIPSATSGSVAQSAAVVTIMDIARVRVEVAVPEQDAAVVKTGLAAMLTLDELPGHAFEGTITRFGYALDEATRTMMTEIELPNPARELRPGMYGSVKLVLERKKDALIIPIDALVVDKTRTFVFTPAGDKAKRLTVKVGFRDSTSAEILEGVSLDQVVLLAAKASLTDGQAVTVVEKQ
jgi:RND family efflux transporter MFP subunit